MSASTDGLIERRLQALRWRSSVFHTGRYCGPWQVSTAGKSLANFHWVRARSPVT